MTEACQPDWTGAIARAHAHAPYLSRGLDRLPELADLLAQGRGDEAMAWARRAGDGLADTGVALRREKQALALALAIGDLAGAFPLLQVTGELSDFADRALDAAIVAGIRRRAPDFDPATQSPGFLALTLGKHGARELNYSSDIDPILLYDPALLPRRERDEPGEAAQRVARSVVEILSNVTGEGYVFRVDLRLRPASEVSPLAISVDAALTHYETSALAWERAAFIRARACAGDLEAGRQFLTAIRPFVWRRSLDFGAIEEIGRLTAQIRASTLGRTTGGNAEAGPGFDLKKGRGGIREIEFYAQVHQLIHGGRNPALRLRGTRETLDALAAAGLIGTDEARLLGESYDRLRVIEHRLQMVQDQQTHALPATPEALDNVARLDGLPGGEALVEEVAAITARVGDLYDSLIQAHPSGSRTQAAPTEALPDMLERLGYADPVATAERIESWTGGRMRALRSDAARAAFDAIRADLLAALATSPEPESALARWERLLENLPSAINLFRLLEARPGLTVRLARILGLAPPLADALARRADLLDPLIDASALDLPGDVAALIEAFSRFEAGDDYQRILASVRRRVGEWRFALGVQLIEGTRDPIAIGAALSRIAEAACHVLTEAAVADFRRTHGVVPESEFLILALGRFGGGVLTHASDLDVVFLFTGDFARESDGRRPIGATLYYNRLCQRVIAALSAPTAEGALFEVDTRLRPSGAQGPPAASIDSFERYQREQAWTWEHMALVRARSVYGSPAAREELDAAVHAVLTIPREAEQLRRDVLKMRATMANHKPPRGPLDIKLARGGLVDLEFTVHFLQLRDGIGLDPDMGRAVAALVEAGLVPVDLATAQATLTGFLVAARLLAPDSQVPPEAAREALARSCGCDDWEQVMAGLTQARATVGTAWRGAFGEELEIAS
ncbi:glutamate-ammonia-ligase adenylyltransferase [Novosphingobium chloroacetimidivorans]|uniref:Glutamate-ammonia-ligase adenylyltransferase n=1 Tax=Novosphingobium chloroacetimidivorans TaxID=1428314 RepID=A0A7W7K894_9SPHN|nr:bifunctional [glutamate--ammonia ligase]-adenylyl-L-tyrosine phosphorylase/[glutamate--ammonia-ligase] adenylyltransferase [Novosphingobium chloroacetimidivorans]MBB4858040.1 glutamate-ammonia-ligase adenylyltransferase [Novosphingobium chloroacetimidivorans]